MSRVWKQNFRPRLLKRYELTFKHNVYTSQLKNTVLENPKCLPDFGADVVILNQEGLVAEG